MSTVAVRMTKVSKTTRIHAQRRTAHFDPLTTRNFDQPAPLSFHTSQRRQLWLEAHFSGCSACQSRSSSCSFSSGTKPNKGDKRPQAGHLMSTAKQFRAKAAESAESLKHTVVPGEIREFQRSIDSFKALAENEDWLANNFYKITRSCAMSWCPTANFVIDGYWPSIYCGPWATQRSWASASTALAQPTPCCGSVTRRPANRRKISANLIADRRRSSRRVRRVTPRIFATAAGILTTPNQPRALLLFVALLETPLKCGSRGRIRTSDQPVNSRLLYH
jgi:hypothetical protein